jgi:hypothetical protein
MKCRVGEEKRGGERVEKKRSGGGAARLTGDGSCGDRRSVGGSIRRMHECGMWRVLCGWHFIPTGHSRSYSDARCIKQHMWPRVARVPTECHTHSQHISVADRRQSFHPCHSADPPPRARAVSPPTTGLRLRSPHSRLDSPRRHLERQSSIERRVHNRNDEA